VVTFQLSTIVPRILGLPPRGFQTIPLPHLESSLKIVLNCRVSLQSRSMKLCMSDLGSFGPVYVPGTVLRGSTVLPVSAELCVPPALAGEGIAPHTQGLSL
jgi:hypothetical protein